MKTQKIVALILALALGLTSGTVAFAAAPEDVKGTNYEAAVTALTDKGIIAGETDGLFHPENTLTRAQACIMVAKASNMTATEIEETAAHKITDSGFKDLSGYGWAEGYISYMVKKGIVSGYPDGTFKPGNHVTMAELLTMAVRAAGFTEDQVTGPWPTNYTTKAAELKLLAGIPAPLPEKATRGMAALVIHEALPLIAEANTATETAEPAQSNQEQAPVTTTGKDAATKAPITRTIAGLCFTGPTLSLSLEDALKNALTSGSSIQAAEIKKQADIANSRGSSELVSDMNEANRIPDSFVSYSKTDLERARKARDYYKSMADRNYEAAQNSITYSMNDAYYSLLHAEEGVRIARENLELQKKLLDTVKYRYSIGVASKQDVLQAEIGVNSGQGALNGAEVQLAGKKISLNIELGFDDMQDVKLTTKLDAWPQSQLTIDNALSAAIANRNELYSATYNIYAAEKEFNTYSIYPKNSAKYLTALNTYNSALKGYNDIESAIKLEVRMNYATMLNNKKMAENSRLNADKAMESYNLNRMKYELGMVTLTETQQARIGSYEAEKAYADSVLAYNLSVLKYEQSSTVGSKSN